jgi:hypothetical protein
MGYVCEFCGLVGRCEVQRLVGGTNQGRRGATGMVVEVAAERRGVWGRLRGLERRVDGDGGGKGQAMRRMAVGRHISMLRR